MKARLLMVSLFVLALLLSLGYVRARYWVVELSYHTTQKRAMKNKLMQEKRSLTLELETLRNPNRIERVARQKLGLTRSREPVSVVILNGESSR